MLRRVPTDQASWASLRTLRRAGLCDPTGVVLGRYRGQLLRYSGPGHVLGIGTTQSGKTTACAYPTLLEPHPETSLVVFDPKEELTTDTWRYRATLSRVIRLTPCCVSSDQYNPLEGIRWGSLWEMRDVQTVSEYLVNPDGTQPRDETSQHFQQSVMDITTGLLVYGWQTGRARTLGAVDAWVIDTGWDTLVQALDGFAHPATRRAVAMLRAPGDKELGSMKTTTFRAFRLFMDPAIARMTSRSDFTLDDLRDGAQPLTLYLSIPLVEQRRLRGLCRLLLRQWLDHMIAKKDGWTYGCLAFLDEVQTLHHFPLLPDLFQYGAGMGLRLAVLTPSLHSLAAQYGEHHPFLESAAVQAVFGVQDEAIAERISKRIGTHQVTRVRRSWGWRAGRSKSFGEEEERLLNATGVQQLAAEKVLVLGRSYRVMADQSRFYDDPVWHERSTL